MAALTAAADEEDRYENMVNRMAKQEEVLAKAFSEVERFKSQNKTLNGNIEQLQQQHQLIVEKEQEWKQKMLDLMDVKEKAENQHKEELGRLRKLLSTKEEHIDALEAKMAGMSKTDENRLRAKIWDEMEGQFRTQLRKKDAEIDKFRALYFDLERKQKSELAQSSNESANTIAALNRDLDSQRRITEALREQIRTLGAHAITATAEAEMRDLTAERDRLRVTVEKLKHETKELRDAAKEERVSAQQLKLTSTRRLAELKSRTAEAEGKNRLVEGKLKDQRLAYDTLRQELKTTREENLRLSQQLEAQKQQAKVAATAASKVRRHLEQRVKDAEAQRQSDAQTATDAQRELRDRCDALEAQKAKVTEEYNRDRLRIRSECHRAIEKANEVANRERDGLENLRRQIHTQQRDAEARIRQKDDAVASGKQELAAQQKDLRRLRLEKQTLQQKHIALVNDHSNLKRLSTAASDKLQQLSAEYSQLQNRFRKLLSSNNGLEVVNEDFRQKNQHLVALAKQESIQRSQEQRAHEQRLNAQKTQLVTKCGHLQRKAKHAKAETLHMKRQAEGALKKAKTKVDSYKALLRKSKLDLQASKREILRLRAALRAKDTDHQRKIDRLMANVLAVEKEKDLQLEQHAWSHRGGLATASAAAASASRISAARTQQVDLEQQSMDLQAYMDRLEVAENRPGGANAN